MTSQQPVKETLSRNFPPDPTAIRAQLQRLLAHPLFTNSKRYPVLLAYTVEQALLGNSSNLKERIIGIEAFGRKPDYDANADPVVRITAAEVRKRLIQYYYDPSHAGELVIELSAGSYLPAFRQAITQASEPIENDSELPPVELVDAGSEIVPAGAPSLTFLPEPRNIDHLPPRRRSSAGWWILAVVAFVLSGALGFLAGRHRPTPRLSIMGIFWEPITSSSNATTYCIGEPDHPILSQRTLPADRTATISSEDQVQARLRVSGRLNMSDVVTLTHTIAPIASRHGAFRVLPASETSFTQLREGPIVLIGAFDNAWTLRLTQGLRYGFQTKDGFWRVVDHKDSQRSSWAVQMNLPIQNLAQDYAIVARIRDNTTGQPVIIVAGISDQGTEAASEVVYNPVYLQSLIDKAPRDWSSHNLEAVIETHVIDGHPGPPDILAVETW